MTTDLLEMETRILDAITPSEDRVLAALDRRTAEIMAKLDAVAAMTTSLDGEGNR